MLFRANVTQTTKQDEQNNNWTKVIQLAIYKSSREVEPETTRNKFNKESERVLNPGSPGLKVGSLTSGLQCLREGQSCKKGDREGTREGKRKKLCFEEGKIGIERRGQEGDVGRDGCMYRLKVEVHVKCLIFLIEACLSQIA